MCVFAYSVVMGLIEEEGRKEVRPASSCCQVLARKDTPGQNAIDVRTTSCGVFVRKAPACSATGRRTERTFSVSAGLDASTVTPGNTAPDVSLTTPAMK